MATREQEEEFNNSGPLFSGLYRVTTEWEMTLPAKLQRKIEDGWVVLWRPHLTLFLQAGTIDNAGSMQGAHAAFQESVSASIFGRMLNHESESEMRAGYPTLSKKPNGDSQWGFNGWVVRPRDWISLVMYHDDPSGEGEVLARATWQSIKFIHAQQDRNLEASGDR